MPYKASGFEGLPWGGEKCMLQLRIPRASIGQSAWAADGFLRLGEAGPCKIELLRLTKALRGDGKKLPRSKQPVILGETSIQLVLQKTEDVQ
jgi:hypothetical protein